MKKTPKTPETPEEQREAKRIYQAEYRKNLSEEEKEKRRYQKRIYDRKYRMENKRIITPEERELKRLYNKEYSKKNKEVKSVYNKKYRESKSTDYWVVYLLPKANYVGVSRNYESRLLKHKSYGRDISEARILHEIYNEEDARRQEDLYHRLGFSGGNGRRGIYPSKGSYETRINHNGIVLNAYTKSLEDAFECRTQFYNQDKDLWAPKFEIDRLT
jgi:hypothetical protein